MVKVARNYFYNLSYQILVLIVPLITTPYISRVLGVKGVGIFSYTNSIVQYFILFGCVGLNLYGQREIAYVQHEETKKYKVFWELIVLRIFAVSISLALFYFTIAAKSPYSNIYIVMMLDILASMIDISWFFQGVEDFKKIVLRNFAIKIVGVILIFSFVKSVHDLRVFVFCHSATLFLGNLSMWLYMPGLLKRVPLKELEISRHVVPTVVLFLPQIATSVYTVLDKTMIGLLTGAVEEVAFYEQGQKIIKIVLSLLTSLGTVMLPRVANLHKRNETEKIREYLSKSFRFMCFTSFPMMFGLIAVSRNIVPWFFGTGYEKVVPNMMIIAPVLVFIALSNIMGTQFLLPTGRQAQYTISVVTGCIVNFCLNMLLIPMLLSIGAAVATIIAELSVTAVQIVFTRKDFDYVKILISNMRYIFSSAIMFVPTCFLSKTLAPGVFHTFICITVGAGIYLLILLILKDGILMDAAEQIVRKFKTSPKR